MSGRRVVVLVVVGIVALLIGAVGGVYAFSSRAFNASYEIDPTPLTVDLGTNGDLAVHGEHVAHIRGCLDCHGEDGGGAEMADDAALGLVWASNLTTGDGGVAGSYTEKDWDRAVRHGVDPEGAPLIFMPSHEFWPLSDDDLAALITYFRSVPAVDRSVPEPDIGPLGRVLYLTGQMPLVPAELINHEAQRPPAPPVGPTAEYGAYLATGCTGCHGPGLSGGSIPGGDPNWPPAKNITPDEETGIGTWSLEDLEVALREGVRPNGSEIDPAMPIESTKHLTDTEIEALHTYLMGLEPRMYGNR